MWVREYFLRRCRRFKPSQASSEEDDSMPTVAEEINEILQKNLNEMETRFRNFISETLDKHLSEFKTALVAIQEENVDLKKNISILKKEKDEMKEEIK